MNTHKLLAVVVVLQIVTILNQWFGGPISTAHAQIPDAGAQRNAIIDQLTSSNDHLKAIDDKLDKLISIFESGKVQVQLSKPDDNPGK
ncbi:MAG: hypothetical protein ABSB33_10955 [Tepidisphaeraceae bacterium]|jgi:hypothetical protein